MLLKALEYKIEALRVFVGLMRESVEDLEEGTEQSAMLFVGETSK